MEEKRGRGRRKDEKAEIREKKKRRQGENNR